MVVGRIQPTVTYSALSIATEVDLHDSVAASEVAVLLTAQDGVEVACEPVSSLPKAHAVV